MGRGRVLDLLPYGDGHDGWGPPGRQFSVRTPPNLCEAFFLLVSPAVLLSVGLTCRARVLAIYPFSHVANPILTPV